MFAIAAMIDDWVRNAAPQAERTGDLGDRSERRAVQVAPHQGGDDRRHGERQEEPQPEDRSAAEDRAVEEERRDERDAEHDRDLDHAERQDDTERPSRKLSSASTLA